MIALIKGDSRSLDYSSCKEEHSQEYLGPEGRENHTHKPTPM